MKQFIQILALLYFCTGFVSLYAQTPQAAPSSASAHVAALKEGGLVVRLNSNTRKLAAMRAVLDTARLSEASRLQLNRKIALTEAETHYQNREIMVAFKTRYQLSPVVFVYDTASVHIRNGRRSGFVLNDSLELDPTASLPAGKFISVRVGYSDPSDYSGAEGFILGDSGLNDLTPPFPTVVAFSNVGYFFGSWLNPSSASQNRYSRAVKKLNKKLKEAIFDWGVSG